MGTVNYGTSDYITLGIEPLSSYDLEHDAAFMEEIEQEIAEYGGTVDEAINDYINGCMDADFSNIRNELDKHTFHYFHIVIKSGYYEGFYLDIENNFGIALNDWTDRREAQKEITEIKGFLHDCADLGLCEVWPGWCTTYNDRETTHKAIDAAVKAMREDVRTTPTWRQYEREAIA